MKKFILFSLIYYTTNAYNLLEHYIPTTITKEFYMCPSINDLLRETTIDVIKDINKYNILFISLKLLKPFLIIIKMKYVTQKLKLINHTDILIYLERMKQIFIFQMICCISQIHYIMLCIMSSYMLSV